MSSNTDNFRKLIHDKCESEINKLKSENAALKAERDFYKEWANYLAMINDDDGDASAQFRDEKKERGYV